MDGPAAQRCLAIWIIEELECPVHLVQEACFSCELACLTFGTKHFGFRSEDYDDWANWNVCVPIFHLFVDVQVLILDGIIYAAVFILE